MHILAVSSMDTTNQLLKLYHDSGTKLTNQSEVL